VVDHDAADGQNLGGSVAGLIEGLHYEVMDRRSRLGRTPESPDRSLAALARGAWQLDPARSRVEFEVPHWWGLRTVRGRFTRYAGSLNLRARPAMELTIDATTVQTGSSRRDRHLHSPDFFWVAEHQYVRFESSSVRLEGGELSVRGELTARGARMDLELEPVITPVGGGEYELAAVVFVMHRWLGITWNPAGFTRPYSRLAVAGRLVAASSLSEDDGGASSDRISIHDRRGCGKKFAGGCPRR
jgi:polyisoprenoid-binding protein YceI